MKAPLLVATWVGLAALADPALANSVTIKFESSFKIPNSEEVATTQVYVPMTPVIAFKVAGKGCQWSGAEDVLDSGGCDYRITVSPEGALKDASSSGPKICMTGGAMLRNCR